MIRSGMRGRPAISADSFEKITILFYIIKQNANYTSFFCKKIWIYELFILTLHRFLKEAYMFNKCKF